MMLKNIYSGFMRFKYPYTTAILAITLFFVASEKYSDLSRAAAKFTNIDSHQAVLEYESNGIHHTQTGRCSKSFSQWTSDKNFHWHTNKFNGVMGYILDKKTGDVSHENTIENLISLYQKRC